MRPAARMRHAGFEIVTFAVEGEAGDRDDEVLRPGDVRWMTAGSGDPRTSSAPDGLVLVQNWIEELKRRVVVK